MAATAIVELPMAVSHRRQTAPEVARCSEMLAEAFGTPFTLWDAETGTLVRPSWEQPGSNDPFRGELARSLYSRQPQFIADEDCVVLLAVPLDVGRDRRLVGTASFVVRPLRRHEHANGAATLLGLDPSRAADWISRQTVWTPDSLLRLANAVQGQIAAELRAENLQREVDTLTGNLIATYEEICLLHAVTHNLRINSDEQELCTLVLRWLLDCLPAEAVAIQLLPLTHGGEVAYKARARSALYTAGNCPLDNRQFTALIDFLHLQAGCGPRVFNDGVTQTPDWPFPAARQLILVPMQEGERLFGWLAMFNHTRGGEFGSTEASLLNSIGAMLGIHASNRDLYREQSQFLESVVRALSSAIDAKDPYTRGHSDRVAQIAVRLAKELGCEPEMLHTLYMAGLLHDIGKIGISDAVLRKSGKLTAEEFEHIKQHPELGYRILADIKQLANVLPAVLHHHEQWDGRGYPSKLAGEQIPWIARITAVADAYDAMTSDRPYRPGLPLQQVEETFRQGAGKQWDARVIDAYFAAREEIRQISQQGRSNPMLGAPWRA